MRLDGLAQMYGVADFRTAWLAGLCELPVLPETAMTEGIACCEGFGVVLCLQAAACQPGLSVCADPSLAADLLNCPYAGCKLRRIQGLLGSTHPCLYSNWFAAAWCSPGSSSSTSCSLSFCLLPCPSELVMQKGALPSPMCIAVSCSSPKLSLLLSVPQDPGQPRSSSSPSTRSLLEPLAGKEQRHILYCLCQPGQLWGWASLAGRPCLSMAVRLFFLTWEGFSSCSRAMPPKHCCLYTK